VTLKEKEKRKRKETWGGKVERCEDSWGKSVRNQKKRSIFVEKQQQQRNRKNVGGKE